VNNAINTLSNGWFYSSTVPYGTVGVVLLGDLGDAIITSSNGSFSSYCTDNVRYSTSYSTVPVGSPVHHDFSIHKEPVPEVCSPSSLGG
jgi:hypothetical protein